MVEPIVPGAAGDQDGGAAAGRSSAVSSSARRVRAARDRHATAPSARQALGGGLEHREHPQAGLAVGARRRGPRGCAAANSATIAPSASRLGQGRRPGVAQPVGDVGSALWSTPRRPTARSRSTPRS